MALSCPVIRDIIHMSSRERRIFLNDVSAEAMEQLINFMYIGEVQISLNTVNVIFNLYILYMVTSHLVFKIKSFKKKLLCRKTKSATLT